MARNERGQFLAGQPMDEELKRQISEGQMQRHLRDRQVADQFLIPHKRCTRCRRVKRVPEDYVMRKRTLKCGEVRVYPSPECKECTRQRRIKWRDDFIRKNGREAWLEHQRQFNRGRDKKKARRYQREYHRMRSVSEGRSRQPWKKYRSEVGAIPNPGALVSAAPFRQWWRSLGVADRAEVISDDANLRRQINRIMSSGQLNVTKGFLYRVTTAADDPNLLTQLSLGLW